MPKDMTIAVAFLFVFLAASDFPREASSSWSQQMTSPFRSPGEVLPPDRTGKVILANDAKQDSPSGQSNSASTPPAPRPDPSDPESNRNLDPPRRASPEAADDLFQLLKQAGPKQASKPK